MAESEKPQQSRSNFEKIIIMKKVSLFIIGVMAASLFVLSQCTDSKKSLFYQENGNYVIDDNFAVKTVANMAPQDVDQLLALEAEFAERTKGAIYLRYIADKLQILRVGQIQHLDQIQRLTRLDKIQRIVQIHKGCFEVQNIDWVQLGDLKKRLDGILDKYKPATLDGNISIQNNQIATAVVALAPKTIDELNLATIMGGDFVNICGDYMGQKAFTRWLIRTYKAPINKELEQRVTNVMNQYR